MARYALIEGELVTNVVEVEPDNICQEHDQPSLECLKWHPGLDKVVIPSAIAGPGDHYRVGRFWCEHGDGPVEDVGGARSHVCTYVPELSRRDVLVARLRDGNITAIERDELLLLVLGG